MEDPRPAPATPDPAAVLTLALVAALSVAAAWALPWWVMKARAPQYGQRQLVVEVGPVVLAGDVREVDLLGHYVGIRPMKDLAPLERTLAPLGLALAIGGAFVGLFQVGRARRLLAVSPLLILPPFFLADLYLWTIRAVSDRDMTAPLSGMVKSISPVIFGEYSVGNFHMAGEAGAGLWLAGFGCLLAIGLVFARPLGRPACPFHGKAAAAALVLGLAGSAPGAELLVRPFDRLAEVLGKAGAGDTVRIEGRHPGHFTVDRRLTLVGGPGAILDGGGEGTVLALKAPGATVRDLEVRGSGTGYNAEDAAIRIEGAEGAAVERVAVHDALFGILVVGSPGTVIRACTIEGKDLPPTRRGDGIRLWNSSRCAILGNRVRRTRDVVIWYSSDTRVEDNRVEQGRYGLHYMFSDRNSFRGNRFEDDQVGAVIMNSRGIELAGNAFSYAWGPSAYGLLLKDADDVFVTGNRFVANATAMFLDNAPQGRDGRLEIRGNLVARNDVGIAMQPLTRRARIWENAFVGNRTQVAVNGSGSVEANDWAVDGRGNYWSDAVPYDRDRDGVSEIPYRVESTFEVLGDRYPALALFDQTPAAEALDAAARLFPVFAPRPKLVDPHPLVLPPLTDWTRGDAPSGRGGLAWAGGLMLASAALMARTVLRSAA